MKCRLLCQVHVLRLVDVEGPWPIILTLPAQSCCKGYVGCIGFLVFFLRYLQDNYIHLFNFSISSPTVFLLELTTPCHVNSETLKVTLFCALFHFKAYSGSVMLLKCNDVRYPLWAVFKGFQL